VNDFQLKQRHEELTNHSCDFCLKLLNHRSLAKEIQKYQRNAEKFVLGVTVVLKNASIGDFKSKHSDEKLFTCATDSQ
jgi:hypothetical protein